MNNQKSALFLHYGPGGNARLEELWLGEDFPFIDFWDQPIVETELGSYEKLLESSAQKLNILGGGGPPLPLMAHSFGCSLALDLALRFPERISKAILLNPLSDIPAGFYNFSKKLSQDEKTPQSVIEKLKPNMEKFVSIKEGVPSRVQVMWDLVGVLVQDPDYFRIYWSSEAAKNKYMTLRARVPALHFVMWKNVLEDYLKRSPLDFKGKGLDRKIEIYIGEKDPYVNLNQEMHFWKSAFPKGKISIISSVAHYIHLELSTKNLKKIFSED